MKNEKVYKPGGGYFWLFFFILVIIASILGIIFMKMIPLIALIAITAFLMSGLFIVNPNQSSVLVLFGKYVGTVKDNGFFFVNPFFARKKVSLRARNFDSNPIKVNDKVGNPIKIGLVLVWKVEDTYKACFDVDQYEHFVVVQSEAALRKLAGLYPYDNFEDEDAELTLRSGGEEINHKLEEEIRERLEIAGIHVIEARINYIAYAEEIAGAMLRRQQATAVVSARFKIVEGAVSMVEMALEELSRKEIITLDEDKKAAMVSNLMVVLCADKDTEPVINTGTLNH